MTYQGFRDNLGATVDPTENDDETKGFAQSSRWINNTSSTIFLCEDASEGAAVWTAMN